MAKRTEMARTIRDLYRPGIKVKLIQMKNEPQMPSGLVGVISCVDDIGQIHVNWENGSTLALVIGKDKFAVL